MSESMSAEPDNPESPAEPAKTGTPFLYRLWLPAGLLVVFLAGFMVFFSRPGLVTALFGERVALSPPGLCVLGAVVSAFWFLVAAGKRRPGRG